MFWILEPYQEVTHTYPNLKTEKELELEFKFKFENQNQIGSTIIKIYFLIRFLAKETQKIGVKSTIYQFRQVDLDSPLWVGWSF
jgi:hypothetical protein